MAKAVLDRRKNIVVGHGEHTLLDQREQMGLKQWWGMLLDHRQDILLDEGEYSIDYHSMKGCFRGRRSWTPGGSFGCWG